MTKLDPKRVHLQCCSVAVEPVLRDAGSLRKVHAVRM
jgi:hypothetical protein